MVGSLKHLFIIDFMDEFNYQTYGKGHTAGLLAFPGATNDVIQTIKETIESELRSNTKLDIRSGVNRKDLQLAIPMVGIEQGKEPKYIPLMVPLSEMQSLDFYKLYVEKVTGVYGVQAIFTGAESANGGDKPRVEVEHRTTVEDMENFLEPWNEQVLPKFNITDWVLKFGSMETRDLLREANIKQSIATTVNTYEKLGHVVKVSEDGMDFEVTPDVINPPIIQTGKPGPEMGANGPPKKTLAGNDDKGIPIQEPEVESKDA
jgi:hypothetical protein